MNSCDEIRGAVHSYIDGELQPAGVVAFEAHLDECEACRAEFEHARAMADTIRGAQPLYEPPHGSLARAEALLAGHPRRAWGRYAAAALFLLASGGLGYWKYASPDVDRGSTYRTYAADSHLRIARGQMPLDLRSSEPAEISAWFQTRLPFHLEIPNYPEPPDGPAPYQLAGARLLNYGGDDVAYLSYTMDQRPISLLVSGDANTAPLGGRRYESGGLDFHFYSNKGLKLIAWVDRGLSYVLVSELDVEGAESCIVCHGAAAERSKFRGLNPTY